MALSKTRHSNSITKEDLESKYVTGFSDGVIAMCRLELEELKEQKLEIINNKFSNYQIALATINKSIAVLESRLIKFENVKNRTHPNKL